MPTMNRVTPKPMTRFASATDFGTIHGQHGSRSHLLHSKYSVNTICVQNGRETTCEKCEKTVLLEQILIAQERIAQRLHIGRSLR